MSRAADPAPDPASTQWAETLRSYCLQVAPPYPLFSLSMDAADIN